MSLASSHSEGEVCQNRDTSPGYLAAMRLRWCAGVPHESQDQVGSPRERVHFLEELR